MNKLVIGAIAGLAATAPMTLAMKAMHRNLPPQDRHPLPPREVTMNIAEKVGLKEHLNEPQRRELTIVSHFAYGAAAGAVYASLEKRCRFLRRFRVSALVLLFGREVISAGCRWRAFSRRLQRSRPAASR